MRLLSRMSFPVALLFAALLGPAVASAHSGRWQDWHRGPDHVYLDDNTAGANTKAGFVRNPDGSLTALPGGVETKLLLVRDRPPERALAVGDKAVHRDAHRVDQHGFNEIAPERRTMIAMKFTIELDIGLSFLRQAAPPQRLGQ